VSSSGKRNCRPGDRSSRSGGKERELKVQHIPEGAKKKPAGMNRRGAQSERISVLASVLLRAKAAPGSGRSAAII